MCRLFVKYFVLISVPSLFFTIFQSIIFLFLVSAANSSFAEDGRVSNMAEVEMLPRYCRGTQQIRDISGDRTPITEYVAVYGHIYTHLHHYCWALNSERKAKGKKWALADSLGDYEYVISKAPQDFVLLPEILTTRARVLFALKRDVEAVADLKRAIELKMDYLPAYIRLGEYYQLGRKFDDAQKLYEQGIAHTRDKGKIKFFNNQLNKIGKTATVVAGSALPEELSKDNDKVDKYQPDNSNDLNKNIDANPVPKLVDELPENIDSSASKSYCRFCP